MVLLNDFNARKIKDKYFLTTKHGSFCVLSKEEYMAVKKKIVNTKSSLFKKLEEREIVINENNLSEIKKLMKKRKEFLFTGTSLHIIVVTLRCNMNCVYCHASSKSLQEKSYDMSEETAKKTVDFIFQTPNDSITIEFQGGEPLLNWEVVKFIIDYSKEKNKLFKKNLVITIVTNFSFMTDDKMNYLIDNEVQICTSLDGPKHLHDENRPLLKKSNYDEVVFWIKKINEVYKKKNSNNKLGALVTITKKSLNYSKEIIDEYINLGFEFIHLRFLNNLGRSEKENSIKYSSDEYLKFWKKSVEYIKEKQNKGIKIHERFVELILEKILKDEDPGYLDLRSPCGAIIGQLAYDYDGSIYSCDEGRMLGEDLFKVGEVKTSTYKNVVSCDNTCQIVNASLLENFSTCKVCAYNPYCGVCPVCNYAEKNNIIASVSQTDRCKIYKFQFDWVVENYLIDIDD